MKKVILVDKKDNQISLEEKIKAHREKKLHRAFSVFAFNSKGELLIQQRAKTKYHSGGIWANTCCSHPEPGKDLISEVKRRLKEEMGFNCRLEEIFSFIYETPVKSRGKIMYEHEFDHVFIGEFNGMPKPSKKEVKSWQWISVKDLKKDIKQNPNKYAYWTKILFKKLIKKAINNIIA
jgi:isopentenyl-diphosphate delta-isomerase